MPTTVNGIGTHYYGKKNRSTRAAPCRSCGRFGELESYDTRLWFVVVFIPIIPLGRKRIIDSCPACRRHMVADANKYQQASQLQVSGSLERFRREGTPEAALGAHATLLGFHEHDQAAELRGQALARFPGDARLRAALADHMRQVSSFEEMARLHNEALALEPDLPEARAGVAVLKLAHGELDDARRLLDFLEEPGAGHRHDLQPLYTLAKGYQGAGRHEEALAMAGILLREVPDLGQRHDFRELVRKSERATRPVEPLLPARRHSLRGLFRAEGSPYSKGQRVLATIAAALVLAAVGLLVSNEYIRRHRTIRVVNACGAPVQVRVDGGPPVTVGESGAITVAEGRHRVQLSGAVQEAHDVELGSGFFERWTHSPLWVLNPGGEAVLNRATLVYAEHPGLGQQDVVLGRPFVAIPHVDYPFQDPPQQLKVENRNAEVTKVAVHQILGQDNAAFHAVLPVDRAVALDFAEHRLRRNPEDALLDSYLRETFLTDRPRGEAFFKAGLARRPLSIRWHRAYQNLADHDGAHPRLLAEYDALLAAEPASGALLYLRGRIDPDRAREADFLRRAAAADPRLPWPFLALGVRDLNLGRWEDALRDLGKARDLKLDDPHVGRGIHAARMALGQAEALAGEYRGRLAAEPTNPLLMTLLFDALAASGHPEAIEPERAAWEARLPVQARGVLDRFVRGFALYQSGRAAETAEVTRGAPFPGSDMLRAQALAAAGRAAEAAAEPATAKLEDAWTLAAVALGLALEGRAEEAATWREKAAALLGTRTDDDRQAAALLRAAAPPSPSEVDKVLLSPTEKALIIALLAGRFPERRAEYLAEAARFNVLRLPPYLLVRRAIGDEAPAKP